MTFDDDCVRLNLTIETHTIPLVKLGLEWPPPERLWIDADGARPASDDDDPSGVLHRQSVSKITDEQRADMTHVFRGAEYRYRDAS